MSYAIDGGLITNGEQIFDTLKELKNAFPAMTAYYRWQKSGDGYHLFAGSMVVARVYKVYRNI